jgi:hypothetical protein
VADLKILAGLARDHSRRQLAAVSYNLYKETGDLVSFDEAIANEKRALGAWGEIVAAAGDIYSEDLAFGVHHVGFSRHWKEELALLRRDFALLQAERAKAVTKPGVKPVRVPARGGEPPAVELMPVAAAVPGRDVVVNAKVSAPGGLKWVRLRYRHLTQYEDYETAGMTLDSGMGLYTGRIPAAFVDPKWDLMYFVEAVGLDGAGRMYPDLEREMPYVVMPVANR